MRGSGQSMHFRFALPVDLGATKQGSGFLQVWVSLDTVGSSHHRCDEYVHNMQHHLGQNAVQHLKAPLWLLEYHDPGSAPTKMLLE